MRLSWYQRQSKETRTWVSMMNRHNATEGRYASIFVCRRWLKFENFLEDMGRAPSEGHTIDRKKNHLGYSKSNCRWATYIEQARNTRQNRYLTVDGKRLTLAEWAERHNLTVPAVRKRLSLGWSVKDAITIPRYATRRIDHPNHVARGGW